MDWMTIFMLSASGVLPGISMLLGLGFWATLAFWLVIGALCAVYLARTVSDRLFSHGFLVGVFGGLVIGLIQVLFFNVYADHNPEVLQGFKTVQDNLGAGGAKSLLLAETPMISIGGGLLLGILTLLAGWYTSRGESRIEEEDLMAPPASGPPAAPEPPAAPGAEPAPPEETQKKEGAV